MRSWSKWVIFSRRMKSSSSVGPRRPAFSEFWLSRDRDALVGRERAVGRIDAHAIERTDRGVLADVRPTAADLLGPVQLADRAGPDNRIGGLDRRAFGRRERRVGVVFGRLVRIEGKRGRDVLRARRLLGDDVAGP